MKTVYVKVTPYGSSSYAIYYRYKGWFNYWQKLTCVFYRWNDDLHKWFPVLFNSFAAACEHAQELKNNPKLIEQHNAEQKQRYLARKKELAQYFKNKNRTAIF